MPPSPPTAGEGRPKDDGGALGSMRWVALLTCFAAAVPILLRMAEEPALLERPRYVLWLVAFAAFVGMFWVPATRRSRSCDGRRTLAWLAVHTILGLALLYLVPNGLYGVYMVIVAASAGEVLALRPAFLWVGAQTVAAFPPFLRLGSWDEALVIAAAFGGFQLFAAYSTHVAEQERQGRETLTAVNAELTATRERLAETTRAAERLRIARDLHDVMGHHLTALSLQLEAARHAGAAEAAGHVETARQVAATLLGEVRQVVSRLREDGPGGAGDASGGGFAVAGANGGGEEGVAAAAGAGPADGDASRLDLAVLLAPVGRSIARPHVHLEVPEELRRPVAPEQAGALLRCAQEAVTNAARHSGADNLWIALARRDGGVELVARDDGAGAGAQALEGGHGLLGMRERLERLGGRLQVDTRPGDGFELRAWLPVRERA